MSDRNLVCAMRPFFYCYPSVFVITSLRTLFYKETPSLDNDRYNDVDKCSFMKELVLLWTRRVAEYKVSVKR